MVHVCHFYFREGSVHVDFRVIINYPKTNSISKDELVIATKRGHKTQKRNQSSVFSCMDFKSFYIHSELRQQDLQGAQVALINGISYC